MYLFVFCFFKIDPCNGTKLKLTNNLNLTDQRWCLVFFLLTFSFSKEKVSFLFLKRKVRENMPPYGGIQSISLLSVVLALLVSDTAAGLASGLARCLALTAAAVLCAFAKVTSFNSFDMFHSN